jgi:copper chaperone CopZ
LRKNAWAPLGAVVLAAASSACCWLPLLALGGGIGLGSAAIMLERYRWILFGAAAVLIGLGFYLNYRREDACAPDGSCPPGSTRLRTINRLVLWPCAALVVLLALFPQVITAFAPAPRVISSGARAPSHTIVLDVGGMTCADCEVPVERALQTLPGVRAVKADAGSGRVAMDFYGAAPADSLVRAKLGRAGYQLLGTEDRAPASRDPASVTRLMSDARELREAFNRDIGTVRIVALLSPT